MPFVALETATFEVLLGENASVEEMNGNTISQSWVNCFDALGDFQKNPQASPSEK
jgi:hypothetical protein